jgi:hypothetical protein
VHELRAGAGRQFDPQVVETMVGLVEQGVFVQVMQQYGRVIEPAGLGGGEVLELDPAASSATAAAAALDGNPPVAHATSEAEAWALEQITDEHWAQPGTGAPAAAAQDPAAAAASQPTQATQWTQEQWESYQMQAAQEQAAFDAQQAHQAQQAQLAAQQAHAQEQVAEQAAADVAQLPPAPEQAPAFDPSQWAAPNPDDLAA